MSDFKKKDVLAWHVENSTMCICHIARWSWWRPPMGVTAVSSPHPVLQWGHRARLIFQVLNHISSNHRSKVSIWRNWKEHIYLTEISRATDSIIYDAFSIESQYLDADSCITAAAFSSLTTGFTVTRPSAILDLAFSSAAAISLLNFISFSTCNNGGPNIEAPALERLNGT